MSNVSGYEIYRATSKNGKYKKVGTVSYYGYNEFEDYSVNYGTYYYKVRAYVKVSGKAVYGPFSDAKVIKA